MIASPRAVLFDLDDTLYAERRHALSGYRQVAQTVSIAASVDLTHAFAIMAGCLKRGERQEALQTLCRTLGHSTDCVPALVEIIRSHAPDLKLPPASVRVLGALRSRWRIGIVTNGYPGVQRLKVGALGLESMVDTVVYAAEHGSGIGKPDAEPFLTASRRLGVDPTRCVFVGDDPARDIAGARAVGMRTIRVLRGAHRAVPLTADLEADAVALSLEEVLQLAPALLKEEDARCA